MKNLFVCSLGAVIGLILGASLVFVLTSAAKPNLPAATPVASTRPDLSFTVSLSFAAAQIQQTIRSSGISKDAVVSFTAPNLIRVTTTVDRNLFGIPVSVKANVAMRVTVKNGRIILTTDSVDAGGFLVPPSVIDSVVEPVRAETEDQINRIVQRELQGTNLHISNIGITVDSLTVDLNQ